MTNPTDQAHISEDEFIDYFDGALDESASEHIERHVADCAACTKWVRKSWEQLSAVEGWTAQSHGQAALAASMNRTLGAASKESHPGVPGWEARLKQWLNASATAGVALAKAMQQLLVFPPETAAVAVLGQGEEKAPPQRTLKLAVEDLPQGTIARVAVDDHRAEIEVRIDGFPRGQRAPLMMLVRIASEGSGKILPLQMSFEGDYLHALFEHVEPGDYMGCFEPEEHR